MGAAVSSLKESKSQQIAVVVVAVGVTVASACVLSAAMDKAAVVKATSRYIAKHCGDEGQTNQHVVKALENPAIAGAYQCDDQLDRLDQVFQKFSTYAKEGVLDEQSFGQMLDAADLGNVCSNMQKAMWKKANKDGNEGVDFEEMMVFLTKLMQNKTYGLELMFDSYNKNGDGKLDKTELVTLFKDHGSDEAEVDRNVNFCLSQMDEDAFSGQRSTTDVLTSVTRAAFVNHVALTQANPVIAVRSAISQKLQAYFQFSD